jgi:predicted metalloprotease with PDZ domain
MSGYVKKFNGVPMKKFFSIIILCFSFTLSAEEIAYSLHFMHPEKHEAEIEITLNSENDNELLFAMPAWAPGRYVIYNFSKNVFDVSVTDSDNQPLRVESIDKQTWKVQCPEQKTIHFKYKVYANTFDGTFSKIESDGAAINGACIFMYIHNRKDRPVTLRIDKPDNWDCITPMEEKTTGIYHAENYDHMIDSPIELGKLFVHDFDHLGKKHQAVFHQGVVQPFRDHFIGDIKKFISHQAAVFNNKLPYDRYIFFFTLDKNLQHTDGMEHRNSCRVILRMDPNEINPDAKTDDNYDNLIWLSAHEFFHTWNIKRLHPKGLNPFDYDKEVYSDCLWIVEGFTSYFGYLSLARSGIYSPEKLYSEFAGRIRRYETSPGKNEHTLAEVCRLTWLFKGNIPQYEETIIDQTTYSYYYKGLVVGLLLDLKLRNLTNNKITLDILMNLMFKKFNRKGYTESDFENLSSELSGQDLSSFFDLTVRSTKELDYTILIAAGLKLVAEENGSNFKIIPEVNPSGKQLKIRKDWLGLD